MKSSIVNVEDPLESARGDLRTAPGDRQPILDVESAAPVVGAKLWYRKRRIDSDLPASGGYSESQTVNNGYAQWDKTVPYGDFSISELPLSGYATWKIFCGEYQDDPSEVSSYDPATFSGNTGLSTLL